MDFLTADISFKYARVSGFIAQLHIATLLLCSCMSQQQQSQPGDAISLHILCSESISQGERTIKLSLIVTNNSPLIKFEDDPI